MVETKIDVRAAGTETDWMAAKALILEYVEWLGFDLSFQKFDEEMAALPAMYNEKDGGMYIAWLGTEAVGVVGLRRFSPNDGEVERMFVKPAFRGMGAGRLLLRGLIEAGRSIGYETIKLDTASFMTPAIQLYLENGFEEIPAYRFNPYDHARYFEYRFR